MLHRNRILQFVSFIFFDQGVDDHFLIIGIAVPGLVQLPQYLILRPKVRQLRMLELNSKRRHLISAIIINEEVLEIFKSHLTLDDYG
jgi:hypothetical protein